MRVSLLIAIVCACTSALEARHTRALRKVPTRFGSPRFIRPPRRAPSSRSFSFGKRTTPPRKQRTPHSKRRLKSARNARSGRRSTSPTRPIVRSSISITSTARRCRSRFASPITGRSRGQCPRQITDHGVEHALATPAMVEATKALQDKKIVLIHVKRDAAQQLPAGAAEFLADPAFNQRSITVGVGLDDQSRKPLRQRNANQAGRSLRFDDRAARASRRDGRQVSGRRNGRSDRRRAARRRQVLQRSQLQTQPTGKVTMTPNKLIWKELWQRPTAMITCLLAIMLGVTALVAIRSVTVYSDKAVARQMSELGANVLLLPKAASCKTTTPPTPTARRCPKNTARSCCWPMWPASNTLRRS